MLIDTIFASNAAIVEILGAYLNRMSFDALITFVTFSMTPELQAHDRWMVEIAFDTLSAEAIFIEPAIFSFIMSIV